MTTATVAVPAVSDLRKAVAGVVAAIDRETALIDELAQDDLQAALARRHEATARLLARIAGARAGWSQATADAVGIIDEWANGIEVDLEVMEEEDGHPAATSPAVNGRLAGFGMPGLDDVPDSPTCLHCARLHDGPGAFCSQECEIATFTAPASNSDPVTSQVEEAVSCETACDTLSSATGETSSSPGAPAPVSAGSAAEEEPTCACGEPVELDGQRCSRCLFQAAGPGAGMKPGRTRKRRKK